MTPTCIDLSCDLGEDPDALGRGHDAAILEFVSSANVACGGHAGDLSTMAEVVRLAAARGVAVGAHPAFPDPDRFGRVELDMSAAEIEAEVAAQIGRLGEIARSHGVELHHVKPHGALYHASSRRRDVAEAVGRGALAWSRRILIVGMSGSAALAVWRSLGLRVAAEAFADRRYDADGSVRARSLPGALLLEPRAAAEQALRIARGSGVTAEDGTILRLRADTIGVHADTPNAAEIARETREALERAGFRVRPAEGA